MATLPASARSTAANAAFHDLAPGFMLESPERLSILAVCREELTLFTRRRKLDWKSQVTKAIVIAAGSALIFLAWKSLVTWIT